MLNEWFACRILFIMVINPVTVFILYSIAHYADYFIESIKIMEACEEKQNLI